MKGQNVFFSEGKTLNVAEESHSDDSDLESSIVITDITYGHRLSLFVKQLAFRVKSEYQSQLSPERLRPDSRS